MKGLLIKSVFLVTVLTSCVNQHKQENKNSEFDSFQTENLFDTIDYFKRAIDFVSRILNDEIRIHEFIKTQEAPNHLEIFSKEGLIKVTAFSNRNFPEKAEPKDYEHFTLFCLEYESAKYAEGAFQELCRLSELDLNLNRSNTIDSSTIQKVRFLNGQSKPGGFILQKSKWIFSLVETCRDTPIGGTWLGYEDLFIRYIFKDSSDSISVLNADCGKMKYFERRINKANL